MRYSPMHAISKLSWKARAGVVVSLAAGAMTLGATLPGFSSAAVSATPVSGTVDNAGSIGGYFVTGPNALTEATAYIGTNGSTTSFGALGDNTSLLDGSGVVLNDSNNGKALVEGIVQQNADYYTVGYAVGTLNNDNVQDATGISSITQSGALTTSIPVGDTAFIRITRPSFKGDWHVWVENVQTGEVLANKAINNTYAHYDQAFYGDHADANNVGLEYANTIAHPRFNLAKTPASSYNITDQQVKENNENLYKEVGTSSNEAVVTVSPQAIIQDHFDVLVQES